MKNLLEIQEEIRRIEKLSSELSDAILSISKDIMDLREAQPGEVNCDYDAICSMAEQISFTRHPLANLHDNYICKLYIGLLVNIAALCAEATMDLTQMAFIQWILNKSVFEGTMEDVVRVSHEFNNEILGSIEELLPEKYKKYLLLDALMVVNINGESKRKALEFISSLCTVFEVEIEAAEACAVVSRIALSQSIEGMTPKQLKKTLPYLRSMRHYLNKKLVDEVLLGQREIIMELPNTKISEKSYGNGAMEFKWLSYMQGQYVEKGETIASYIKAGKEAWTNIRAKQSGCLFFFTDRKVKYGVLSHEKDDRVEIQKWIRELKE